jgi:hypothetical protein
MTIIVWAVAAMVLQDVFATLMSQAENRGRRLRSGFWDACMWLCGLTTNHFALNSVNGHNLVLKAAVIVFVSAANIAGSAIGVWIGDRFFPDPDKQLLAELVTWARANGFSEVQR